jgi:hypothetical protein
MLVFEVSGLTAFGKKVNPKRECYTAPPEMENRLSNSPLIMNYLGQSDSRNDISTKEYYDYYYAQKPLDPRLQKPTWDPMNAFA